MASAPSYHPSQKAPSVAESATSIDMTLAIDEMGRDERADLVARELVLKVGAPATLQALPTRLIACTARTLTAGQGATLATLTAPAIPGLSLAGSE